MGENLWTLIMSLEITRDYECYVIIIILRLYCYIYGLITCLDKCHVLFH
jgi:hypothetical protein